MPRELVVSEPGKLQIQEYQEPALAADQIRIRSEFAAPKHGTESHNLDADSAFSSSYFDDDYRMFLPGEKQKAKFPKRVGNMAVGTIIEAGAAVTRFTVGDRVYGHLPIRETHTVSESRGMKTRHMGSGIRESRIHPLPDGMTPEQAVLLDPAHFALAAVRDADIRLGEWVSVYGLGAIGLMIVQMAKRSGAERIFAVDPLEIRRQLAKKIGAEEAFDPAKCDPAFEVKKATDKHGADVAIDVSGSYHALQDAIRSVRYSGLVIAVSNYRGAATPLRLDQEWHHTRVTVKSSMPVWGNPSRDYPLWDDERLEDTVYRMMLDQKLITNGFLHPIVPFDKSDEGYMLIGEHPDRCIKLGVRF